MIPILFSRIFDLKSLWWLIMFPDKRNNESIKL